MGEKKQSQKNMQHKNPITNDGVVITIYVESMRSRSIKKTKQYPRFKIPQGYDRRAQLLAYSRELRNEGSEKVQQIHSNNESLPGSRSKASSLLSYLITAWISSNTKNV
ncbi:hypothetical protein RIF29_16822 [Crotalaria pallida]|uniref:Uncharacterized protein n=1 Tax=Crotalaria pallida TaxID=3830 RepID=A0AAN9FLS6_CROPI